MSSFEQNHQVDSVQTQQDQESEGLSLSPPPFQLDSSGSDPSGNDQSHSSQTENQFTVSPGVGRVATAPPLNLQAQSPGIPGEMESEEEGLEAEALGPDQSENQFGDAPPDDNKGEDSGDGTGSDGTPTDVLQEDGSPTTPEPPAETDGMGSPQPPSESDGSNNGQASSPESPGGGGGGVGNQESSNFEQPAVKLDSSSMASVVKSLAGQQPTGMVKAFAGIGNDLNQAQKKENTKAKDFLPEVMQPTGLAPLGSEDQKAESKLETGDAPELKQPSEGGSKQEVEKKHPEPSGKNPAKQIGTPSNERLSNQGSFSSAIQSLPETDQKVNTSAGPRPKIKLQGDIDPAKNVQAQTEGDASLENEKVKADTEIQKDFGENGFYPTTSPEMLKAKTEISSGNGFAGGEVGSLPEIDAQIAGPLNSGILNQYQTELASNVEQATQGENDYLSKADEEREKGLADIEAENEKTREQQIAEQAKGKQEIQKYREEWAKENEGVRKEYKNKSAKKKAEIDGKIQAKVSETNSKVQQEYANAEKVAKSKTNEASNEIRKKKREAEKKKDNRSWWQKVKDAVSSFFEKLKEAVSIIFDALRKAVSAIIEKAKALAGQLIDMARNMIKGLIDAFAGALKAFVRLALAAFPGIAEKFCNFIDAAANAVKSAIDGLADALKKTVEFLLDAVGTVVNALLHAYEAIILAMMGDFSKLIGVFLEIMRGIANLVKAAMGMPSQFMGQASEEMLGSDVTEPLQNEYPALDTTAVSSSIQQTQLPSTPQESGGNPANDALLAKTSFTEDDFQVPVLDNLQLDPALIQQLAQMGDGEMEFGEMGESHGIDALKADTGHSPQEMSSESVESTAGSIQAPTTASPVAADPSRDRFAPDGAGKVGPFSVGERTRFIAGQMVDGIKKWLSENWPMLLAALIGIIGGAVLANILTGGAIMAALPVVMQLVSAYFAAEAIMKMASYFGKYLGKSFPGDIAGGAKALARGLAIGAIELVFALMFGGKAAIKAVKSGAKTVAKSGVKGLAKSGTKMAREGVENTVKNVRQLGSIAKTGAKTAGQNVVNGGKFVMGGLKRGALTGAKSLDDVAKRLGKMFKFKKFKIKVQKKKLKLMGKMNPWILIATSDLEAELKWADDVKGNVGSKVTHNGNDAIIVGGWGKAGKDGMPGGRVSGYVNESLTHVDDAAALRKQFDELDEMTVGGRQKEFYGQGSNPILDDPNIPEYVKKAVRERANLRGSMKGAVGVGDDAHHLLPVDVLGKNKVLQDAMSDGFNFNAASTNGMSAPRYSSKTRMRGNDVVASKSGIHASHGAYSDQVDNLLNRFGSTVTDYTPAQAKAFAEELATNLKAKIGANCVDGVKINQLFTVVDPDLIFRETFASYVAKMAK